MTLTVLGLWGLLLRPVFTSATAQAQGQLKPKPKPSEAPKPVIPVPVGRFTVNLETGPKEIVRNLNREACWYRVSNLGPKELKISGDWAGRPVMLPPDQCLDLEIRADLVLESDDSKGWYERIP